MLNLYDDPLISEIASQSSTITTARYSAFDGYVVSGSEHEMYGIDVNDVRTSGISMFSIRAPAIMPLLLPSRDAIAVRLSYEVRVPGN